MAKNLKELNEILKNYIGTALILTQWDIREILEKKVEEYYDEYQPVLYERTWKLRNSLQCSNIKFEKKGVSCTVGWDNYYITMQYKEEQLASKFFIGLMINLMVVEYKVNINFGMKP